MMKVLQTIILIVISILLKAQVPVLATDDVGHYDIAIPMEEAPRARFKVFKENNLYGVKENDNIIIAPLYDDIKQKYNFFIVTKKGKQGLFLNHGKEFLGVVYDSIIEKNPYVIAYAGKKMKLYSMKNKYDSDKADFIFLSEQKRQKLLFYSSQFLVFENDNKKQFIATQQGKFFENTFEKIIFLNEIPVIETKGKFAFLMANESANMFYYDDILKNKIEKISGSYKQKNVLANIYTSPISAPYYLVEKDKKFGIVNQTGILKLSMDYDKIIPHYEGNYFYIHQNKKVGLYKDSKILPIEYESITIDGNYVFAKNNKITSVFSLQNFEKLPVESETGVELCNKNEFVVQKNGKYGLLDEKGSVLIPFIFEKIPVKSYWNDDYPKGHYKIISGSDTNELQGIYDVSTQKIIIPMEHKFVSTNNKLYYIARKNKELIYYDFSGKILLSLGTTSTESSPFQYSSIEVHRKIKDIKNPKTDEVFLVDKDNAVVIEKDIISYEMIYDEEMLYNPLGQSISAIQHKNGKFALFNEKLKKKVTEFEYDEIKQRFAFNGDFYIVRKGGKYGVINSNNSIIIPFEYDDLSLYPQYPDTDKNLYFTAQKNGKFGLINKQNKTIIPFEYKYLESVSPRNLFKAKKKDLYQLIDLENKVLNKELFDEISYFEFNGDIPNETTENYYRNDTKQPQLEHQALTFKNGKVKMVNAKGVFIGNEENFKPQNGYKTFDELKFALVKALESKNDDELRIFCQKIAPSSQTLYWLRLSLPEKKDYFYDYEGRTEKIAEKYFQLLFDFKIRKWNSKYYDQNSLRRVKDFTLFSNGLVTVKRNTDWAYDDTRLMEKVLRNSMKVNGVWISTFFTRKNFEDFR